MTNQGMTLVQFEQEFLEFEENRMYPLGYRKETAMRKVTQKDVAAISHAEQYIWPTIKPSMGARQRQEIEDDLERLAEIKSWLLKAMYEPGLPFTSITPTELDPNGHQN